MPSYIYIMARRKYISNEMMTLGLYLMRIELNLSLQKRLCAQHMVIELFFLKSMLKCPVLLKLGMAI